MSRFYAEIQGNRGEATRMGHQNIRGHIRGWNVGVEVRGFINDEGNDCFDVYRTGGSHGRTSSELIATIGAVK